MNQKNKESFLVTILSAEKNFNDLKELKENGIILEPMTKKTLTATTETTKLPTKNETMNEQQTTNKTKTTTNESHSEYNFVTRPASMSAAIFEACNCTILSMNVQYKSEKTNETNYELPKKIHFIWIGSKIKSEYVKNIEGYVERNPEYEVLILGAV